VADIVAVAQDELTASWSDLPIEDGAATKRGLTGLLRELLETFAPLAAGAGADWYAEARAEAGVVKRFTPSLVVPVIAPQIEANAGWAVGPLFGNADPDLALRRSAGVLQKLTANADRATILTNARRDPAKPRWYRGASAKCCAFCAMVASRGAMYRSEETADFKAHNNCRCFPAVAFPGEAVELPDYYQKFTDEYATAAEKVAADGGTRSASAVLSKMRELSGRA
jgi:hypothetical protein